MPAISVIIGTYNHLPYLQLSLFSLERQTFKDFEVIVADDGSRPDVRKWLQSHNPTFPITHLWQEDKGFRKCKILNKAVLHSRSEYLVFTDADCILSKNFLKEHWTHREKGKFLGGRRIMIAQKIATNVKKEMILKGSFDSFTLWGLYHSLLGNFKYYEETLRPLHRFRKKSFFNLLGCNFSIHKSDLFTVNGFDEDYEHRGGGEDTDIAMRLNAAGYLMKSVRYLALQFHLGHNIMESKSKSEMMFLKKKNTVQSKEGANKIKSSLRLKNRHLKKI